SPTGRRTASSAGGGSTTAGWLLLALRRLVNAEASAGGGTTLGAGNDGRALPASFVSGGGAITCAGSTGSVSARVCARPVTGTAAGVGLHTTRLGNGTSVPIFTCGGVTIVCS